MYIKSIVLDGFKSYGQRTEITGFDNQFNAITGLNGSGKSNILDSICFVLGISNLSHVRANSLQDLIYRSGQAGINKATVSITFDNQDPDQCPPGFEDVREITITRQIILGGKNKYMINGSVVVQKKVQDFFCSCQLNVNNPHFLIMQGKITKVLNMKPPEILAMIEEAAGTKMYETKKQVAQKTIEKKDTKFQELNTIYNEEIGPKLEKLRKERSAYMEYKVVSRELEHLLGLYQAWQFVESQRTVKDSEQLLKEHEHKVKQLQDKIVENKQTISNIDDELKDMSKKAKNDDNQRLEKLEDELQENEKLEAQTQVAVKSAKDNLNKEVKKKQQLEEAAKNDNNELKTKQNELAKMKASFEQIEENDRIDNEAYIAAQKRFEALSIGMEINDDGEAATLQEQLMNAKEKLTNATTEKQQSEMELKHYQQQFKQKQQQFGSNEHEFKQDEKNLEIIQQEVGNIEKSLKKLCYSEEKMNELHVNKQRVVQEIRNLKSVVENFEARRPYTTFRYRDPETNFNRNSVKGVACRLFTVNDPIANLALETAGGGRLFNIIIDSEATGKKLLQRGNLQQRTTFIPLNKIDAHGINDNIVRYAQDLVGVDNVKPALAYIKYDKTIKKAMEYIFGNVFICKDINVAKQVAFHPRIQRRCVTLDGDTVDPAGTLSGGAPPKGDPILKQLRDILEYEEKLKSNEKQLNVIENEIQSLSDSQQQYLTIKERLTMKKHEMDLIKKRLQNTTHYRQQEEINNLQLQIEQCKKKIEELSIIIQESNRKIKELEKKIRNSTGSRDAQLKNAEFEMNQLKQKALTSRNQWKQKEERLVTINLEIKEIEKSLEENQTQIQATVEMIEKLTNEYERAVAELDRIRAIIEENRQRVNSEKSTIAAKNKDMQRRLKEKEKLNNEIVEFELQIKKQGYDIKKIQDDVKKLKSKHDDYKKKLQKHSQFIENAQNMTSDEGRELELKIRRSQENVNKLQRVVNEKAQSMLEQQEAECNELKRKHRIVEADKKKIVQVIVDLDRTKEEALKIAYEQISKDFGSIFSTLLPGANAKLVQLPNCPISAGLEIKVSLGGVWKDNLTELSGGQRSLAALSLILAMLLFKPAPLYILDEVDAALDLSHTQNIGSMLRTHFKKSQFIIVSLKDGMFNNANVLFKTQFIDGVSTITRSVNKNY